MRLFTILFLSLCFCAGLTAQAELNDQVVEGYIINGKGKKTEGILFLNVDEPDDYAYLLQNRVGFLSRADFDQLEKKAKAKHFKMYKPKDLSEYGFGERRFLSRPYTHPSGDERDLARMGRNYFFELHLASGPVEILRIRTVADKVFGTSDGDIHNDIAIYREGMKRPETSDVFDYQTFAKDCDKVMEKLEAGRYPTLKYRKGKKKKGLGGMIGKSIQQTVNPVDTEDIFNLVADYVESCVKE